MYSTIIDTCSKFNELDMYIDLSLSSTEQALLLLQCASSSSSIYTLQTSAFRGSAWTYDDNRRQFYYHAYLDSQPDLNASNPYVRQELLVRFHLWRTNTNGNQSHWWFINFLNLLHVYITSRVIKRLLRKIYVHVHVVCVLTALMTIYSKEFFSF